MKRRTLFVIAVLAAAAAAGGCQLVSGASSLDIVDDAGGAAETSTGADATDESTRPPQEGGPGLDAAADADAPFVACTSPEGGTFTTCTQGGLAGIADCVEYCATLGKCCAEDCAPYDTDPSLLAAQFHGATESACIDPLSVTSGSVSSQACSFSKIPPQGRYFKCCCR